MPIVLIEVRRHYNDEEAAILMKAVHSALAEAFQLPASDRNVRLVEHAPDRFAEPPGLARPDRFTQIYIDAFEGRSLEAKRKLYRLIVENVKLLNIPPDHVRIVLRESPLANWGLRGGQAACDVELGFKVDV